MGLLCCGRRWAESRVLLPHPTFDHNSYCENCGSIRITLESADDRASEVTDSVFIVNDTRDLLGEDYNDKQMVEVHNEQSRINTPNSPNLSDITDQLSCDSDRLDPKLRNAPREHALPRPAEQESEGCS